MSEDKPTAAKLSKGERTAARILDAAEDLFARRGYAGTSLRQIADAAGIREPGLYNHFAGKQLLYQAVLFRALNPVAEVVAGHLQGAEGLRDYTDLPALLTDMLIAQPQRAALFQQALQDDSESPGYQLITGWLDSLFDRGVRSLAEIDPREDNDRETLALNVIAMFNLITGYFLAQQTFTTMTGGDIKNPATVARQKKLLHRVVRAMLIS